MVALCKILLILVRSSNMFPKSEAFVKTLLIPICPNLSIKFISVVTSNTGIWSIRVSVFLQKFKGFRFSKEIDLRCRGSFKKFCVHFVNQVWEAIRFPWHDDVHPGQVIHVWDSNGFPIIPSIVVPWKIFVSLNEFNFPGRIGFEGGSEAVAIEFFAPGSLEMEDIDQNSRCIFSDVGFSNYFLDLSIAGFLDAGVNFLKKSSNKSMQMKSETAYWIQRPPEIHPSFMFLPRPIPTIADSIGFEKSSDVIPTLNNCFERCENVGIIEIFLETKRWFAKPIWIVSSDTAFHPTYNSYSEAWAESSFGVFWFFCFSFSLNSIFEIRFNDKKLLSSSKYFVDSEAQWIIWAEDLPETKFTDFQGYQNFRVGGTVSENGSNLIGSFAPRPGQENRKSTHNWDGRKNGRFGGAINEGQ